MSLISKWISASFFIFTFLFVTFSTSAQNIKADSLFAAGNYTYAALEYERIVFECSDIYTRNAALVSKAESLKRLGKFEQALETVDRISLIGLSDSLRQVVLYQKILCAYLAEKYTLADSYSIQVLNSDKPLNKNLYIQISLLRALAMNEQQRWNDAKEIFVELKDTLENALADVSHLNMIIELYSRDVQPKIKSEKTLFWLSFIPGAGMAYAGKPFEGIVNFGINAGALAFGVYQIYYGYYLTGYFGGAIILEKFYLGGRKRGEYLLKKRNYEVSAKYNHLLKSNITKL